MMSCYNAKTLAGWLLVVSACTLLCAEGGFVSRKNHQLMLDGKPFYFLGANAYWLIDSVKYDKPKVDNFFKQCQSYGLKVIRVWAFNHNMPQSKGVYNEDEFKGLDYIIYSAGKHDIHLVLALGNTWEAYKPPEHFMKMAGLDPSKTDLLDFYKLQSVRDVYKDHIWNIVNRRNTYNGVKYRDDPTVMLWDVMNEPRCPGCMSDWEQAIHQDWIRTMSDFLKNAAPNQLNAAGTEGFFMDQSYVKWNPGAGTMCEGENWLEINRISSLDVSIVHVYDRQLESIPPTWKRCDYACYLNFFIQYMASHERAAREVNKPLLLEEFNILVQTYTPEQRTIFFQVVYDYLLWQKNTGGAFCGAMFWSAAIGESHDDGYNLYLDVNLNPPPKPSPTPTPGSGSQPQPQPQPQPEPEPEPQRAPVVDNKETLNDFRRGPQRARCAEEAAKWWLPVWDADWAKTVDISSYQRRTAGKKVQEIIKSTAAQLYGWQRRK